MWSIIFIISINTLLLSETWHHWWSSQKVMLDLYLTLNCFRAYSNHEYNKIIFYHLPSKEMSNSLVRNDIPFLSSAVKSILKGWLSVKRPPSSTFHLSTKRGLFVIREWTGTNAYGLGKTEVLFCFLQN